MLHITVNRQLKGFLWQWQIGVVNNWSTQRHECHFSLKSIMPLGWMIKRWFMGYSNVSLCTSSRASPGRMFPAPQVSERAQTMAIFRIWCEQGGKKLDINRKPFVRREPKTTDQKLKDYTEVKDDDDNIIAHLDLDTYRTFVVFYILVKRGHWMFQETLCLKEPFLSVSQPQTHWFLLKIEIFENSWLMHISVFW